MSLTLTQAKVGLANKVDQNVIDEFRRDSFILRLIWIVKRSGDSS